MLKMSIIGNLAAPATLENVNGNEFITMRVAHSEKYKSSDGQTTERTTWVRVSLSSSRKAVLPYLQKGVKVFARGNVSFSIYDSKVAKSKVVGVDLYAVDFELCGSSRSDGAKGAAVSIPEVF